MKDAAPFAAKDTSMPEPTHAHTAREWLRRLALPHATDFGERLLRRGKNGVIHFREFLHVAREFVADRPEQSAQYLAVLIALEMNRDSEPANDPSPHSVPSRN
jgi:hypothetical protein